MGVCGGELVVVPVIQAELHESQYRSAFLNRQHGPTLSVLRGKNLAAPGESGALLGVNLADRLGRCVSDGSGHVRGALERESKSFTRVPLMQTLDLLASQARARQNQKGTSFGTSLIRKSTARSLSRS